MGRLDPPPHYRGSWQWVDNNNTQLTLKVNSYLSVRRWMLANKLKINYLKTEFKQFRFVFDLSGLSVSIGGWYIMQPLKVTNLGVIFDPF